MLESGVILSMIAIVAVHRFKARVTWLACCCGLNHCFSRICCKVDHYVLLCEFALAEQYDVTRLAYVGGKEEKGVWLFQTLQLCVGARRVTVGKAEEPVTPAPHANCQQLTSCQQR